MNTKIVSGLLLALCAVGIWQATIIPESTMYSEVGPILALSSNWCLDSIGNYLFNNISQRSVARLH